MKFAEALKILDVPTDNQYGKIVISSKKRNRHLFYNKDGMLFESTCEWPATYEPIERDFMADDWEIYEVKD